MKEGTSKQQDDVRTLRLMSFNIQAGTATTNYRDYVTQGWKQVLPHQQRNDNLTAISELLSDFDIVGLQESDLGSLRSGFVNQTQYLAEQARFPYWSHQENRRVSRLASSCNGLLSRIRPSEVHDYKLPGRIPGRGALVAYYGSEHQRLLVVIVHLSLGRRSRQAQLAFVSELIGSHDHVIVMGDMNSSLSSFEMKHFIQHSGLLAVDEMLSTFPSWRPQRGIDHILLSDTLSVVESEVLDLMLSDHRPITMTIKVPSGCVEP